MNSYPVIRNGELIEDGSRALPAWDRSFHFGDGLFESLRAVDRCPLFLEAHLERSRKGMERMGIQPPEEWHYGRIASDIALLLDHLGQTNGRIRSTISRKGGGAYTAKEDGANHLIECTGPSSDRFQLPEKGPVVGVYPEMSKKADLLSPFKCTSAPLYVMAQRWATMNGLDEALIQGEDGRIIESATSNIFLLTKEKVLTPPVENGCVDGVMRGVIIRLMESRGWSLEERSLRIDELSSAQEILLSNAVQGIRPVAAYRDQRFFKERAEKLVTDLNEWAFS